MMQGDDMNLDGFVDVPRLARLQDYDLMGKSHSRLTILEQVIFDTSTTHPKDTTTTTSPGSQQTNNDERNLKIHDEGLLVHPFPHWLGDQPFHHGRCYCQQEQRQRPESE
mmetsp:Transcript_7727/g.15956  ORF Transcript_7727/g.15956 Transcript_7727/m.15956 type:complete len:110 (+) Transcript_7727:18-347(+)